MVKSVHRKDTWLLAEDIPNCDLYFSQIWLNCFVRQFGKNTGRAYSKILCRYEGYHLWFYFGEKDSYEVGENIVERIVKEKDYAREINGNIILEADKLRKFCKTIPQKNLDKLSNKKLWKIYDKQDKIHKEYYTWCWIPVAADMFHNNLTDRVREHLWKIGVSENKLTEYFITLTQPTKKSLIFIEQQELLKIGEEIKKIERLKDLPASAIKLLEQHRKKYYYTKFLWVAGEYTLKDYMEQLREIMKGNESCAQIIAKQNKSLALAIAKKKKLMKELKLDEHWRNIFTAFGDFMVTKIYRRYAQIFAMYQMDTILKEIARRFCLTVKQVRFMLPAEVKTMLLFRKYDVEISLERTRQCVYYVDKKTEKLLIGNDAKKMLPEIKTKFDKEVKELKGEVACPGYGKGKVKIIIRAEDMKKMRDGDILVSIATDPDIVPAMKRAAAIVTEQGGVTSHAAIVSRELNIPCVIGTKIVTRVLKDGDVVEVDATRGVIRIIKQ